ncbi:MAG: hypothetical protein U1F30_01795 [Steroidobacteraceae bacterium]
MVPGEHRRHQRLVPAGPLGELGRDEHGDAGGPQLAQLVQHAAGELEALEGAARVGGVPQHGERGARIGERGAARLPGARRRALVQRPPAGRFGQALEQRAAGLRGHEQQHVEAGEGARAGQPRQAADRG